VKLWVDDERDPSEWLPSIRWFRGRDPAELGEWLWARTAPEAIALLASTEIDELSLDHDLGDLDQAGTGYEILLWIEERVATDDDYSPPMIHIHTSNIGARDLMESALVGIARIVARRGS